MEIKLRITRENEDGSADAIVDYDDEGQIVLIQYGIVAILKEAIEQEKQMGKKKNLKKRIELEDAIQGMYNIHEDLTVLYEHHANNAMTEDELSNTLLGLTNMVRMKCDRLWDRYINHEQLDKYATNEMIERRKRIMEEWNFDDNDPDGRC